MGETWPRVIALGVGILAAGGLWWVIGFLQKRSRLLRSLGVALRLAALAVGLRVTGFLLTETPEAVETALDVVLIFAAAVLAIRILGVYFFDIHLRQRRGVTLPPLIPPVILGVAYLVTAWVTLEALIPGLEWQGLLATSAITSLVLGLALQPILGNFFAGLVISLEKPFRIHDWVELGGIEAQVQHITWRTTHLNTRDNDNLVVPNSEMASAQVINFFYPHALHMERIYVGVHYRTPPYRAREALLAAAASVDGVLDKPTTEVYLVEFGDSSISYEVRIWIEDFASKPRIVSEVRVAIWEEFDRRGIVIPFPIRTLEIEPRAGVLELRKAPVPSTEDEAKVQARIFVAKGPDRGKSLLLDRDEVIVGRANRCDLCVSDRQASKEHFRVSWEDDHHVLTDLESTHGTLVNSLRISERRLQHLDRISFGNTELVFEQRSH